MKRRNLWRSFNIFCCAACCLLISVAMSVEVRAQNPTYRPRPLADLSESLQDISAKISPSVVQIIGTGYGLESDEEHSGASILSRQRSTGSGVIVSADGFIITNAHVVKGARTIRVKLTGQPNAPTSVFEAKLIGMDTMLDLALLKIEAKALPPLHFGNSLEVKQGELVLAFGSPLGMDNSVSWGVVSSPARQLSEDDPRIYIQTDAPINQGSSGGPLVDVQARLVGMNTF